jgi:uncharacterized repeat protein (TIGR03803 family)
VQTDQSKARSGNVNPPEVRKVACAFFLFCFATIVAPGQTFTTLASFDGSDGQRPWTFVQGVDGNFYGTTQVGGNQNAACPSQNGPGCGTIFRVTPSGVLTTLYKFCSKVNCADGDEPFAGLILATDGNFYGAATSGGTNCSATKSQCGTIFKITPSGKLTTLYNFCTLTNCSDGASPYGPLIQADDGYFYGTTSYGGANQAGTIFRLSSGGKLTTLYSFCTLTNCTDGSQPTTGLVQAVFGYLYGTTSAGGSTNPCFNPALPPGCGTVFKLDVGPTSTLSTLYVFGNEAGGPNGLVQGTDGIFYGTTLNGGSATCNEYGCGTVFKITKSGSAEFLYDFCTTGPTVCVDGANPLAALVQATDGNFYGTTSADQVLGTVFKITAAGALTTLHNFTSADGFGSSAALLQATSGKFYGTTSLGGGSSNCTEGCGTVFRLDVGLGPFVATVPTQAKAGAKVIVLGNNLTGTTAVKFNGTASAFTVLSDTEITATVPNGATTGEIDVTTPGGMLSSSQEFLVRPQVFSFSPTSGAVGTTVVVTGEAFTEPADVSFGDGGASSIAVNSDTQITVKVPAGATTGVIAVGTNGGRGQSATSFTVTP